MKTPALSVVTSLACLSALLLAGCASVVKPSAPVAASKSASSSAPGTVPGRRPMFSVNYPPAGGPVTVLTTTPPVVENVAPGLWRVTFPQPQSAQSPSTASVPATLSDSPR